MDEKGFPNKFSLLFALAFLWMAIAGLLALQLWPDLPHSKLGWPLFIVFGPPLYVCGEAVSAWVFSRRHGQAISGRDFSFLRILLALPVMLVVFAVSWWLSWLLAS